MKSKRLSKFLASLVLILTFLTSNFIGDLPGLEWAKIKDAFASPGASSSNGSLENIKESAQASQSFQTDLFTGRAQFSIPIFTPPGRRGLTPQVGLTYSSSGGNGWIGAGWGLDHGFIQRSTKKGVPSYNDNQDVFTFVLNGVNSDLVHISGNEYHAKDESGEFLKFTFNNNTWTVLDKSGTEYTFGPDDMHRMTNARGIFCWCLEKVKDVNGNTIRYSYLMDQGEMYPSRIDYNGNDDQTFESTHSILFVLEDRPDITFSYITGAKVTTAKRLHEIQVKVLNQLSRKYTFTYEQSQNVNRSRLTSVQECGTDGATCLPPQTFTYSNHQLAVESQYETVQIENSDYYSLQYTNSSTLETRLDFIDVDGDGIQDRVMSDSGNSSYYRLQFREGMSFLPIQSWSIWNRDGEGVISYTNSSYGANQVDTLDLNGDGMADRVFVSSGDALNGDWKVQINTGTGFLDPVVWHVENGSPGYWWWGVMRSTSSNGSTYEDLFDINGDGIADRVMGGIDNPHSLRIQFNTGNGFGSVQTWLFQNPTNNWIFDNVRFAHDDNEVKLENIDLNGDGLSDRVYADVAEPNYNYWLVAFNNGNGFDSPVRWDIENGNSNRREWGVIRAGITYVYQDLIDINGDGLPDRVMKQPNAPYTTLRVQFNTGSGFAPSVLWNINNPNPNDDNTGSIRYNYAGGYYLDGDTRDFDGDGLPDRIQAQGVGTGIWKVARQLGTIPDLLSTINNGRGGVTTIEYKPSTQFDNRDVNGIHRLPFPVQVVSRVTQNDGMGNSVVTNYSYKGGMYDAPTREFRGFRETTVTDAIGTQAIHTFHQDEHKKGRPLRTEIKDVNGNLFSKEENVWGDCNDDTIPGVHFVKLRESNSFIYDGNETFKQTRKRFDYDLTNGNLLTAYDDGDPNISTDDKRSETQYALNPDLHILNTISDSKVFNAQNQKVSEKVFYYDGAVSHTTPPVKGLLTRQEDLNTGQSPGQGLKTEMTYDDFGNLLTVKDARGYTTTNEYDTTLHIYLVRVTNALGHTQEFTYNPLIAQITETRDANGQISRTIYDALGRSIKAISPYDSDAAPTKAIFYDDHMIPDGSGNIANRVVTYQKKSQDAPPLTIDGEPHTGYLTVYSFMDGLGRELSKRTPAEDSNYQIVSGAVTFNSRGQIAKQYVPYFANFRTDYAIPPQNTPFAEMTYDAVGRRIQITHPESTQEHPVISRVQYNDYEKTTIDPNGHSKRYTQDSSGNLAKVEEFNQNQTYTTLYEYDTLNRLTRTTNHYGHVTAVTYDQLGRKTQMNDPNMGLWRYAYDENGNLKTQTDAKNQVIKFFYDPLNRLIKKSYPNATAISYVYDACPPETCGGLDGENYPIGRLLKVHDFSGIQLFRYDKLGRVIQDKKFPDDGSDYSFARLYDPMGRVTSLEYPDGDILTLAFNNAADVVSMTLISNGQQSSILSNVHYNSTGQITRIQYGNGVTTDYTYNPQNFRLEHVLTRNQAQTPLQDLAYTFDNVGNVSTLTDSLNTNTQSFLYDDLDRLTQATGSYGTHNYQYDAIGNILQKAGATFQYQDARHTQAVTRYVNGSEIWNYTYDANGNMVKRAKQTDVSSSESLIYDYDNRLIRIQKNNKVAPVCPDPGPCPNISPVSIVMEAVYDASGQRVKKKSNEKTTYYLGKDYEVEYAGRNSLERKAFFLGETRIAEKEVSSAGVPHIRFFHQDHLSSTNVITNETGERTLLMEYLPYGEAKVRLGSDPVDNTYTGQKEDLESSLMYYNARYYDPKLGRFISADSVVSEPANPQEFNRYSYVNNNPIKYTDPSGHKKKKSWWRKFFRKNGAEKGAVIGAIIGSFIPGVGPVVGGMIGGAIGGGLGAAANGGHGFDIVLGSVIGAAKGYAIGSGIQSGFQGGSAGGGGPGLPANARVTNGTQGSVDGILNGFVSNGSSNTSSIIESIIGSRLAYAATGSASAKVGSVYLFQPSNSLNSQAIPYYSALRDGMSYGPMSFGGVTNYSHSLLKVGEGKYLDFQDDIGSGRIIDDNEFARYYKGRSFDVFEPIVPVDQKSLMENALSLVGKPYGFGPGQFSCSFATGQVLSRATGQNFLPNGSLTSPSDLAKSSYLRKRE